MVNRDGLTLADVIDGDVENGNLPGLTPDPNRIDDVLREGVDLDLSAEDAEAAEALRDLLQPVAEDV